MNSSNDADIDFVHVAADHALGDGFSVRRAIPNTTRRMIGPFIFLDQMGPHHFEPMQALDVRPHPHIGLATVTYLLQGEMLHRDSLGNVQTIVAGDVNWMTAGRGIVHSERVSDAVRARGQTLFGLQCWVALPKSKEDMAPAFSHYAVHSLPSLERDGMRAKVIAGRFLGLTSPVTTASPLVYVDIALAPGARFHMDPEYDELALYCVEGELKYHEQTMCGPGTLLALAAHAPIDIVAGANGARVFLLGGEPFEEPRHISWNFVSSSIESIERAKQDWLAQRFEKVAGETEFIPLPDIPGRPGTLSNRRLK